MARAQTAQVLPRRSRLRSNIAALFVLQAANYILPLILLPFLVRMLGADHLGRLSFAQAFCQYFVVLTDYGFNLTATRAVAANREDSAKLHGMFWNVMAVKAILTLLGFVLMSALVFGFDRFSSSWELYFLGFLLVVGNAMLPSWFFQGMETMRHITMLNLLSKLISTALVIALVRGPSDLVLAIALQSLGWIVAGALGFALAVYRFRIAWLAPSRVSLQTTLKDGWSVFVSTAAVSMYTISNPFILGLLTTPTQVAYYTTAERLVRAVQGLLSPVAQALYPHLSALASKSREEALTLLRRVLQWMGGAALLSSLGLLVLAGPLVHLYLGPPLAPVTPVLRLMAFVPLFIALSNIFGIQTMLPFGLKQAFSRVLLGAGLLNIGTLVPLALAWGAQGAAVAMAGTELAVALTMALVLRHHGILSLPGGGNGGRLSPTR